MGRKTTFKATNKRHLTRENLDVAKKGNFKRETESLLTASQNNAMGTNHIKTGIDKTQQNIRCWLYGDRDEIINHIISDYNKGTGGLEIGGPVETIQTTA